MGLTEEGEAGCREKCIGGKEKHSVNVHSRTKMAIGTLNSD